MTYAFLIDFSEHEEIRSFEARTSEKQTSHILTSYKILIPYLVVTEAS